MTLWLYLGLYPSLSVMPFMPIAELSQCRRAPERRMMRRANDEFGALAPRKYDASSHNVYPVGGFQR